MTPKKEHDGTEEFYVFRCKDIFEVMTLKKLFVGPSTRPRWISKRKKGNKEYFRFVNIFLFT